MPSVTSPVMSYDVIMYIHQPHTITEAAELPTFTLYSSSIKGPLSHFFKFPIDSAM